MTDQTPETSPPPPMPDTYVEMFDAYVSSQDWIGPAEAPLAFHARRLAAQLDAALERGADPVAAKDSSYLQAVERLNRRRPVEQNADAPQVAGQSSVFDFLED